LPVLPLEFQLGQRQKQAQIASLMLPTERVLYLSFEIRLNDIRGLFNLIFPAVVSNMLLRKLVRQGMVRRRRASADDSARLRDHLLDCEFTLALELLHVPVRIRNVTDLKVDQILPLHHSLRAPMSISVNTRSVFTGLPVSCGALRGGLIQDVVPIQDAPSKDQA
jgi:flagellar motor switch protein FliM